jgi:hypothetical protein
MSWIYEWSVLYVDAFIVKTFFSNKLKKKGEYSLIDVRPCRLVEVYQHFRGMCCFHLQG